MLEEGTVKTTVHNVCMSLFFHKMFHFKIHNFKTLNHYPEFHRNDYLNKIEKLWKM
jgi:hypothetical protein